MKVCYFGIYDPSYARNRILIEGLRQNGVEVLECTSRKKGIVKYFDLFQKHRRIKGKYDSLVVGFPGYQAMIFARFLTRKPIIFDCFSSLYDSMVWDRKEVGPQSARALYSWLLDWLAMQLADRVLFDTKAHVDYASFTFSIRKEKFRKILVGAQTDIFFPLLPAQKNETHSNEKIFSVLFFGTFIPLQGIEYIIGAAKRLSKEDVVFSIVGDGQMKKKILRLAGALEVKNVTFADFLPPAALVQEIANADICLGIFGNTEKARRVIPNKVYECLAMKKPVITADTPAIRELLDDNDVFFVKAADSDSLARGILHLKNNKKTMEKIAQNGYDTFIAHATPHILGKQLQEILNSVIS